MTITDQQREAMIIAAIPLMSWISNNCHPHTCIQLNSTCVELLEGVAVHSTEEHLRD